MVTKITIPVLICLLSSLHLSASIAGGTGKTRDSIPTVRLVPTYRPTTPTNPIWKTSTTFQQTNFETTSYPGQIPCREGQHMCVNGQCVITNGKNIQCDGFPDCLDASDEKKDMCVRIVTTYRPTKPTNPIWKTTTTFQQTNFVTMYPGQIPCREGQHMCVNGQCVITNGKNIQCDGFPDCLDASDEKKDMCANKCQKGWMSCGDKCVERTFICDTFKDCSDGRDELNCANTTCREDEYRCSSGNCIPRNKYCNGRYDCKDWSDEPVSCAQAGPQICNSSQLGCVEGGCVDLSKACDERLDCSDGSDERHEICANKCASGEFKCTKTNQCIETEKACDGVIDCLDGSDEGNKTCAICPFDNKLSCSSGFQCYSREDRCDGEVQCMDKSDELNCESCKGNTTICLPGRHCMKKSQFCDNVRDCSDGSDENNCACQNGWYKCKEAHCIPNSYVCDGNHDCPLGNDEEKGMCKEKCGPGMYQCMEGKCINREAICDKVNDCPYGEEELFMFCRQVKKCEDEENLFKCRNSDSCIFREWMCDGVRDCARGEDEAEEMCRNVRCKEDFIKCPNEMKCIHEDQECDGREDCMDGSDELGCAIPTKLIGREYYELFVNHNGSTYPVCADNKYGKEAFVCNYLAISYDKVPLRLDEIETDKVLYFKGNYTNFSLKNINGHLALKSRCDYGYYKLNCSNSHKQCGMRKMKTNMIMPNIVNGFEASKGDWPWYVLLKMPNGKMCGGSIVSESLILTTADCVSNMGRRMSASLIHAFVGTCRLNGEGGQMMRISKVILHPYFVWFRGTNNVALLKMMYPVKFTDMISPVCLPDALGEMEYKTCHIVGFGNTRADGFISPYLLQARVNLMTQRQCILTINATMPKANFHLLHHIDNKHNFCAGLFDSDFGSNFCKGDFGGPLVCETLDGRWEQVGIADENPGNTCKSSIFTKVKTNLDFIYSHINKM